MTTQVARASRARDRHATPLEQPTGSATTPPLDVLVIYQHSMLWEILRSLFSDVSDVALVGIEHTKLNPMLLAELTYDAIIVDADVMRSNAGLAGTLCGALINDLMACTTTDDEGLDESRGHLRVIRRRAAESPQVGSGEPPPPSKKLIVVGLTSDELVVLRGEYIANADTSRLVELLGSKLAS
ncbi:MAG: hypothetical protein HY329_10725 [Chloroflexi bacterium]|nr:hypothetical protein [Chloroflexota bacterium]